ncbi:MAG: deoxyribonuclease V [Gammaproteobacteria bacterium]
MPDEAVPLRHPWALTPKQAIALQNELRTCVMACDAFPTIERVAGVDVGFESNGRITRAAVVVLSFPNLAVIEHAIARCETRFPYVPGLLSFREAPAVLEALTKLNSPPNVLLCDGQGLAHPRRFGLACHLGVVTDLPSVGVAKKRLLGDHEAPPEGRGTWTELHERDEIIGAVLRTRVDVKPVFVSVGHRISLKSAVLLVMACVTRYRLPETTRLAHRLASAKGAF